MLTVIALPVLLLVLRQVPVAAQAAAIVLTVRLHTVTDVPVPNIAVQVVDAAADHVLAAGTTDTRGQARFTDMPATEIRVRLAGTLPDGPALRHTRQDQQGIWVNLPAHNWVMDLRVDVDGLVFPDLGLGNAGAPDDDVATAIAANALPAVYPTASLEASPVVRMPTSAQRPLLTPVSPPAPAMSVSQAAATVDVAGLGLLAVLVSLIAGVLWLAARSRL
jgi:hypothetical protein